jgi:hypothetical protein
MERLLCWQGHLRAAAHNAIGGTSANTNTVQTLDEKADLATTVAKLNKLIWVCT